MQFLLGKPIGWNQGLVYGVFRGWAIKRRSVAHRQAMATAFLADAAYRLFMHLNHSESHDRLTRLKLRSLQESLGSFFEDLELWDEEMYVSEFNWMRRGLSSEIKVMKTMEVIRSYVSNGDSDGQ